MKYNIDKQLILEASKTKAYDEVLDSIANPKTLGSKFDSGPTEQKVKAPKTSNTFAKLLDDAKKKKD